jgi:hypothetical protein
VLSTFTVAPLLASASLFSVVVPVMSIRPPLLICPVEPTLVIDGGAMLWLALRIIVLDAVSPPGGSLTVSVSVSEVLAGV